MATNRFKLFLYSNANITGCLLALCGLALFFLGVIHQLWWVIVPGLYSVGALAWPRSRLAQTVQRTELSADQLAQQVRRLVDNVAPGIPNDSLGCLRSIQHTLFELLPRLEQMRNHGVLSPKDSFTVTETVRRYLPDTLGAYLRLPRLYAQMQPLADGRTASQTLLQQLRMLDQSLQDIARNAFAGDAERLITNGRFLQNKFAEKLSFKP